MIYVIKVKLNLLTDIYHETVKFPQRKGGGEGKRCFKPVCRKESMVLYFAMLLKQKGATAEAVPYIPHRHVAMIKSTMNTSARFIYATK